MAFEKIKKMVIDQLRIKDESLVTMTTNLKTDLKADSLDLAELLMSIEEEFGVEIPAEKALEMKELGEVVALVESLKK